MPRRCSSPTMRASVQYFLCRGLSVLVSILAVRGVGLQLSASAGVVASTAAGRSTNFGVSVVAAGVAAWAVLGVSEAVGSADAVIKLRDCSASAVADTRIIAAIRMNLRM